MESTKIQKQNGLCLISGCPRQSVIRGVCQSCRQTLQRRMKAGLITRQMMESILAPSKRLNVVDQLIGLNSKTQILEHVIHENN